MFGISANYMQKYRTSFGIEPVIGRFILEVRNFTLAPAFYRGVHLGGIVMFKFITMKSVAVAAAAIIAAAMAIFVILAPPAKEQPEVVRADVNALAKGDHLHPLVKGAACSARSWPNYNQSCQFDLRTSADQVRPVRVLDLERARPLNVVVASR
jgi:hypothetical protein